MEAAAFVTGAAITAAALFVRLRARSALRASADASVQDAEAQKALPHAERFGEVVRPLFALNFKDFTHLNHGSYGTAPWSVMHAARAEMERIEAFPDDWMRRRAQAAFTRVSDSVAEFIGAEPGSVVMVENATVAVNAVLRSLRLQPGEVCVFTDNTYNACKNAITEVCAASGAVAHSFVLSMPAASPSQWVDELRAGLRAAATRGRVRFVLLDHITSPTAVVMPIADMTRVAQQEFGALVMVDGAHAPGQLPLRLAGDDAAAARDPAVCTCDWYTGNLHKWMFTIKGVAFLYASRRVREGVCQSLVISHNWKLTYQERFFMQGTNDQSRYMSVPASFAFVERLGGVRDVVAYNTALVRAATHMLTHMWNTAPLCDDKVCAPFLVAIEAPLDFRDFLRTRRTLPDGTVEYAPIPGVRELESSHTHALANADSGLNERVAQAIFTRTGIQSQFFFWMVREDVSDDAASATGPGAAPHAHTHTRTHGAARGKIFCRISAQVYNTLHDYRRLGLAVLQLAREVAASRT